jgi:putative two-component system response regulator
MSELNDGRSHILIVDDEPINIRILSNILSDDYKIRAATSGKQAIEIANNQPPDIILLDMIMPDIDGLEVCKKLKSNELTCDIPVIFITSMTDPANEERGLEAGAVDYISKPVSPPVVKARVRIHIQYRLTVNFLEGLLSSKTTSLEQAQTQAKSLLVFV